MSQRRRKYRYSRQPRITSYTCDMEAGGFDFQLIAVRANWTGHVGVRREPRVQLTSWIDSRAVGHGTNLQQIPKGRA